jgi:chromosomal replication initiation ATPase DnaA
MTYHFSSPEAGLLRRRVELAMHAVAVVWEIEAQALKSPTRGEQEVALARQIAMYVAHVALGVSLKEVAQSFGRDRTTARHACRVIEDRRDEPAFDERMRGIETALSVFRVDAPACAR